MTLNKKQLEILNHLFYRDESNIAITSVVDVLKKSKVTISYDKDEDLLSFADDMKKLLIDNYEYGRRVGEESSNQAVRDEGYAMGYEVGYSTGQADAEERGN